MPRWTHSSASGGAGCLSPSSLLRLLCGALCGFALGTWLGEQRCGECLLVRGEPGRRDAAARGVWEDAAARGVWEATAPVAPCEAVTSPLNRAHDAAAQPDAAEPPDTAAPLARPSVAAAPLARPPDVVAPLARDELPAPAASLPGVARTAGSLRLRLRLGDAASCPYADYQAEGSFDPLRRYVALSAAQIAAADARNPFLCAAGGAQAPPRYARSVVATFGAYGNGIGSSLNQMLDCVRYGATYGVAPRFPGAARYWVYGRPKGVATTWTTLFSEVTAPECIASDAEETLFDRDWGNSTRRHMLRLYDRFYGSAQAAASRNSEVLRLAGLEGVLQGDNDVQAMRILFRWAFRLQPAARARVEEIKAPLVLAFRGRPFVSMHVRWGDKVGDVGTNPPEAAKVGLDTFARAVSCYYGASPSPTLVFVATDDMRAVGQLRALLGPDFDVLSLAAQEDQGHLQAEWNTMSEERRWQDTLRLWAEVELLAQAELFVGDDSSNIWRIVHYLRIDKPVHSSVSVRQVAAKAHTCCAGPPRQRTVFVQPLGGCTTLCTA
jgi:hypothetical protein